MERPVVLRPLSIQDENSAIPHKKVNVDGKSKSTKPMVKKAGAVPETRKALNDITNKKSIRVEASAQQKRMQNKKTTVTENGKLQHNVVGVDVPSKGKSLINEEFNIADEGFLHDHSKCNAAQKAELELNFWDTVFPGKGTADLIMDQQKSCPYTDSCPELEELSMSGLYDSFDLKWKSPPTSPVRWSSPPRSPSAWDIEPMALKLQPQGIDI